MVELLEDAIAFMRSRAEQLRVAGQRVHDPFEQDPLVVLLVDELAALTAYLGDRDLKKRAEAALQVLLSQVRAAGVLVVTAVQDPGKDVVGFREPVRIRAAYVDDADLAQMVDEYAATAEATVRHLGLVPDQGRL